VACNKKLFNFLSVSPMDSGLFFLQHHLTKASSNDFFKFSLDLLHRTELFLEGLQSGLLTNFKGFIGTNLLEQNVLVCTSARWVLIFVVLEAAITLLQSLHSARFAAGTIVLSQHELPKWSQTIDPFVRSLFRFSSRSRSRSRMAEDPEVLLLLPVSTSKPTNALAFFFSAASFSLARILRCDYSRRTSAISPTKCDAGSQVEPWLLISIHLT
jgi:hypothetical protein